VVLHLVVGAVNVWQHMSLLCSRVRAESKNARCKYKNIVRSFTEYDKIVLFPKRKRRLTLSHAGLTFIADKLHRIVRHVRGEVGERMNGLQIRSHQGKWDRRKQAGKTIQFTGK
jgi:hypothetical protein